MLVSFFSLRANYGVCLAIPLCCPFTCSGFEHSRTPEPTLNSSNTFQTEIMSHPAEDDNLVALAQEAIEDHQRKVSFIENEADKYSLSRRHRLFGRQKPLHAALGGGKAADVILWRNKQISAGILAGATVIWLLFEWMGYHLLPFLCHFLILTLAMLFLWSNLSSFINKSPPNFPDITLSQELCTRIALLLKDQVNQTCFSLREVASGKDLKKFVSVSLTLWVVSVVGSWFEFLTLLYILFVMLLTAPLLYEMNEDLVDAYADKAANEINMVLRKLPNVPFIKNTKQH